MNHVSRYLGLFSALSMLAMGISSADEPAAAEPSAEVDVDALSLEVITTIAGVALDENGETATVYADNDVRVIRAGKDLKPRFKELMDARRNGWEVSITLSKENDGSFSIVDFEIKSRENKLTTGFDADRTFAPLTLTSRRQVQRAFRLLYPYEADYYDVNDNCFNRAHFWSRSVQIIQNHLGTTYGMDKVFIFFSEAYIRKYDHKWWYHVAPMLYMREGGQAKPWAFDPTFFDSAEPLSRWLAAFDHHTGGECVRINSIDEYYANNHRPICMYITASMFNYTPSDLGSRKLSNWRCYDFKRLMAAIPAPGAKTSRPGATWRDPEFSELLPEMCR